MKKPKFVSPHSVQTPRGEARARTSSVDALKGQPFGLNTNARRLAKMSKKASQ